MKTKILNNDLKFDIDKIAEMNDITISLSYDENLEYPFALDVADSSYFYHNKKDCKTDYSTLKKLFPMFNFQ